MLNSGSNTGTYTNTQEEKVPQVKIAIYSLLQKQAKLSAASSTGLNPVQGSGFPVLQPQLSPSRWAGLKVPQERETSHPADDFTSICTSANICCDWGSSKAIWKCLGVPSVNAWASFALWN